MGSTLPLIVPWARLLEAQSWKRWFKVWRMMVWHVKIAGHVWVVWRCQHSRLPTQAEGTRLSSPAKPSRKSFADRTFTCHESVKLKTMKNEKYYENDINESMNMMNMMPRSARSQSLGPTYSNCHTRSHHMSNPRICRISRISSTWFDWPETPATPRKLKLPMSPTANRPAPRDKLKN